MLVERRFISLPESGDGAEWSVFARNLSTGEIIQFVVMATDQNTARGVVFGALTKRQTGFEISQWEISEVQRSFGNGVMTVEKLILLINSMPVSEAGIFSLVVLAEVSRRTGESNKRPIQRRRRS